MAYIVSLAHAVPQHKIMQRGFSAKVAKASKLDAVQTAWLERVYEHSAIDSRYSVLEEFCQDVDTWTFWNNPSTQQRNEQYKLHAPILSLESCRKALQASGYDPKSITHIIYVSCTGIIVPGIQVHLQKDLGLDPSVKQFGINMMGCFGAFKALQLAHAFVDQDPSARVLCVCTELCSLHFQQTTSQELQIGNALFADASAACIVAKEKGPYRLVRHESMITPDTSEKMTWDLSDNGLLFGLKKDVPELLEQNVRTFAEELLPENKALEDCAWPIHPGGKGILQAIERALGREMHKSSWDVLRQYGNTSSSSFLIVLEHFVPDTRWAIGLGFGPGLTLEGVLLECL